MSIKLGVNIDHIATVRQARKTYEPDPVQAAFLAERNGADGITVHLREDRRHIQDRDVQLLRQAISTRMNLEMGMAEEIVQIALATRPEQVTLVPEKREEITTEGGLDVIRELERTKDVVARFRDENIKVSLFIDPVEAQIEASAEVGADFIEIHTGTYANQWPDESNLATEIEVISKAAEIGEKAGLGINAGHGLTYHNVQPIAAIPQMNELNIGHSIISRAVFSGLADAVAEMKRLMVEARI